MLTVRLSIKENAMDRVMQSLNEFTAEGVVIINEDKNYLANQKYLSQELNDINIGTAEFVSHEEFEISLVKIIEQRCED